MSRGIFHHSKKAKTGVYQKIVDRFNSCKKADQILDPQSAKNKHDSNRKDFTKWVKLRNKIGACWDVQRNTVTGDDDWWTDRAKEISTMLLIGNSSTQKTHYDVLSVKEDATYDQIRSNYKAAILDHHPDKLQTKTKTRDVQDEFINAQKAWEVLSDSMLRANYDKELRSSRREVDVTADEIRLDEMSVEDLNGSKEFFHECRCGDFFSVSDNDLEKMGIALCDNAVAKLCLDTDILPTSVFLPCGSCSLKIRLIIDASG